MRPRRVSGSKFRVELQGFGPNRYEYILILVVNPWFLLDAGTVQE